MEAAFGGYTDTVRLCSKRGEVNAPTMRMDALVLAAFSRRSDTIRLLLEKARM